MKTAALLALSLAFAAAARAGSRGSTNYSTTDVIDSGGRRTASANYLNDASLGGLGSGSSTSASYAIKAGYPGQTFEVVSFSVSASPTNVSEGDARQLIGTATLDDNTVSLLTGSSVGWSILNGPVAAITNGYAVAATVYQNTPATVRGDYQQKSGTLGLLVLNVNGDDFGLYAGDGLSDDWQVQYFGESNPGGVAGADPDLDGQTNAYEYVVGTVPTNAASLFALAINHLPGPSHKLLTFSPRFTNRTYTVQFETNLVPGNFAALTTVTQNDSGTIRMVADTNAVQTNKFYRVQITFP